MEYKPNKIEKAISQNNLLNLKLSYFKGHSGSLVNTIADELAKKASKDVEEFFVPLTKQFIARQFHITLMNEWNNNWGKEGKSTYTYTWIKNLKFIPDHFPTFFYSSQALTGHGRFWFYFLRFRITEHSQCSCTREAENFDHYLIDCQLLTKERRELAKTLGDIIVIVENQKSSRTKIQDRYLKEWFIRLMSSFYRRRKAYY